MDTDIATQVEQLADRVRGLSSESVDKPVLVYFDIVGICWPIRCLLHLKGVDYELVQVPIQAWAFRDANGDQLLKACFRNGHMPLYVDPDVYLTQSSVIMYYLGEKHGLMGDGAAEKLAVMDVLSHAYDALFHWTGLFPVNVRMNTPEDVVTARLNAFLGDGSWGLVSNGYRNNLDPFERYLDANPHRDSGFIVGSRLSIADLHAFNVLCNWYKAFDRERFTAEYPRLDEYIRRIAAIPEVDDYIRTAQEPTLWFPLPQFALRLTSHEELVGLTA
jgi:glutathione S-transferase